jgi:hypothetical protein
MGGIILAFKNYRVDQGVFGSDWAGWSNFTFFFQSQDAWQITRNTVGLNLIFIFTVMPWWKFRDNRLESTAVEYQPERVGRYYGLSSFYNDSRTNLLASYERGNNQNQAVCKKYQCRRQGRRTGI